MPWKECKPMDERLRFIARLLEGEKMAPLCREFGISRVTGYKIFKRYQECGLNGLNDRRRAPYRQANRLPYQVERAICSSRSASMTSSRFTTMSGRTRPSAVPIRVTCIHPQRENTSRPENLTIHSTIVPSASPAALASASTGAKSISRPPSPAKPWASERLRTRSRASASWSRIWGTSTMRGAG